MKSPDSYHPSHATTTPQTRSTHDIMGADPESRPKSASSKPRDKSTLTRSASRSKGISLNLAVSPVATTPSSSYSSTPLSSFPSTHKRSVSSLPVQTSPLLPKVNERSAEDLKYDLPLPQMDQLVSLDIDEQLRLLALKEMCIVEIKDNINNLTQKLDSHEKELHKLREVIQKSLYRELNSNSAGVKTRHQRQNSNPREEAIASTKNKSRRRTLSSSMHYQQAKDASAAATATTPIQASSNPADKRNSKLWTNLAKPLNMLQQFDTMLQNEFERSLISTPQQQHQHPQHLNVDQSSGSTHYRSRNSEDSISSYGSLPSPLKSKSKSVSAIDLDKDFPEPVTTTEALNATSLKPPEPNSQRNTEDMLQTVSSSIWSFVNDVKTNVLSSLSEEESKGLSGSHSNSGTAINHSPMYNLDTGSTIHLNEEDESNGNTLVFSEDKAPINNSDYEDLLDPKDDDLDDKIDLSMYSNLRKNS